MLTDRPVGPRTRDRLAAAGFDVVELPSSRPRRQARVADAFLATADGWHVIAVVCGRREPGEHFGLARRLIWHVAAGGRWVEVPASAQEHEAIAARWHRIVAGEARPGRGLTTGVLRELRRGAGSVEAVGGLVAVTKSIDHCRKLSEGDVATLAPSRLDLEVTEPAAHAGGVFTPDRRVSTDAGREPRPDDPISYPRVTHRRYEGRLVCHDGMVLQGGSTLLPETFKWFEHRPLENGRVPNAAHFARQRDVTAEPQHLPGRYYYFDYKNSGHYGHLLTEGVSKLWA